MTFAEHEYPEARILLVDDDPLMLELLSAYLHDPKLQLHTAGSGEAALQVAAQTRPDLILLDMLMAGISGIETCKRLKADAATADVPVIFITAASEPGDVTDAFAAGAADYVRKPLDAGELLARVRNQLLLIEARRRDQQRLMQSEKLSHLGELLGAMAHELATPIGNAKLANDGLSEGLAEIRSARKANRLAASTLDGFLDRGEEAVSIARQALDFAAALLHGFKTVAVDQCSDRRYRIDVYNYLQQVLLSLRPKLKRTRVVVEIDGPHALEIDTDPGVLAQIITNLVNNSLIHAFDAGQEGRIHIGFGLDDGALWLRYRDDGKGIPAEHLPHVFEAYFTTRKGQGGSGLGMHIVSNLVQQRLGGTISCSSAPGQGVQFDIRFPLLREP